MGSASCILFAPCYLRPAERHCLPCHDIEIANSIFFILSIRPMRAPPFSQTPMYDLDSSALRRDNQSTCLEEDKPLPSSAFSPSSAHVPLPLIRPWRSANTHTLHGRSATDFSTAESMQSARTAKVIFCWQAKRVCYGLMVCVRRLGSPANRSHAAIFEPFLPRATAAFGPGWRRGFPVGRTATGRTTPNSLVRGFSPSCKMHKEQYGLPVTQFLPADCVPFATIKPTAREWQASSSVGLPPCISLLAASCGRVHRTGSGVGVPVLQSGIRHQAPPRPFAP